MNINKHYIFKHEQYNYQPNCSCCLPDYFDVYECISHDLERVASQQDDCLLVIVSSLDEEFYDKINRLSDYTKPACEWLAERGITWEFVYEAD